ncbi:MAG: trigger factor [Patescibacteria group bacterium]
MKTEIKKLPKSEIEIEFELTAEEFQAHFEHAIEHLKHHVKVDGFRAGKAPASMVEEKIKPESLLMEAGDHAVKHVYTDYVVENKLEPIGEPDVQITKIVPIAEQSRIRDGEAIGTKEPVFIFKVKITVLPDIELPDYKEIASRIKTKPARSGFAAGDAGGEISVTEEEIQDALSYLQKTRAKFTEKNPSSPDGSSGRGDFVEITYQNKDIENNKEIKDKFILGEAGFVKGFEEQIIGMRAGEEKEFTLKLPARHNTTALGGADGVPAQSPTGNEAGDFFKIKVISAQKMELPEINDEFAKTLGAFDTLTSLKESLKSGITIEKTEAEKQRKRSEILEKISEKANFEMPEKLVEYEQERLFEDMKNQISQNVKISFEEYLASIKKTKEELKETFKKEAEKRIKSFLVLRQIGKQENIKVSEEEINEEIKKVMKNPFDAAQGKIDINQLKEYTKDVIHNEKVFHLLENFSS